MKVQLSWSHHDVLAFNMYQTSSTPNRQEVRRREQFTGPPRVVHWYNRAMIESITVS
jgi:hypothetical protein